MLKLFAKVILSLNVILFTFCSEHIIESTPSIDEIKVQSSITPTFSEIQTNIFNQSCALSGCHVSGSVSPNLSGVSYLNIVSKSSSTGMDYIEPGDPDKSYLLLKVLGSNSISGSRMPLNSSPLTDSKLQALTDWILDGAENN